MSKKQFIDSPYGFLLAVAITIVAALTLFLVEDLKQAHAQKHASNLHDSALQAKARKLCDERGGLTQFRATKTKGLLIGTASCLDSTLLVLTQS